MIVMITAASACGGGTRPAEPPPPPSEGRRPATCTADRVDAPPEGYPIEFSVDPRDGVIGGSPECGAERPGAVFAILVPGAGLKNVFMQAGTEDGVPPNVEPIIGCGNLAAPGFDVDCFPEELDGPPGGVVKRGYTLNGGWTVYFGISTFRPSDPSREQSIPVQLRVVPATTPLLDRVTVSAVGTMVEATVIGRDAGGDAVYVTGHYLDEDGAPAYEELYQRRGWRVPLEPPPANRTQFEATAVLPPAPERARFASIAIRDAANDASDQVVVPLRAASRVPLGAPCDLENVCSPLARCESGVCALPPDLVPVCDAAMLVDIPAPAGVATSRVVQLTSDPPTDGGRFEPPCSPFRGASPEHGFRLRAPAVPADLIVRTDTMATHPATDTAIYVRRDCVDVDAPPAWCSEDVDLDADDSRSRVEIQGLTPNAELYVFVEAIDYRGMLVPYDVTFELRPVLTSGAACDPRGVENRCGGAPCAAGGSCP